MDYIINWGLIKHPLNWFTIILMVIIGGLALHFVTNALKQTS